mgnify:CR=1 FL=1
MDRFTSLSTSNVKHIIIRIYIFKIYVFFARVIIFDTDDDDDDDAKDIDEYRLFD